MKDMSDNNNRSEHQKEEKLFRALSGVDEELLLRSEQGESGKTGNVHRFPMRYVTRIAAACMCFVVAGALYITMSSIKMADSTSADTAAPQLSYSVTEGQELMEEAAVDEVRSEDIAGAESEIQPEAGMADSASTDSGQQTSFPNKTEGQKQESTGENPEDDKILKKQGRQLTEKMTAKGQ